MSRHCIHNLKRIQQFNHTDSISRFSRHISSSPALLKDDEKNEKVEQENKEQQDGAFSRFKKEFLKDLESNDKSRETVDELRKKSAHLQAQYEKYVGSYMPKSMPAWPRKSVKEESEEPSVPKVSLRERAESLKVRLQKERLQEDYNNLIQTAKSKSEASYDKMRQWRKKSIEKEVLEEEEISEPPKPNVVHSKMKDLFEKSGIADNPLYQKARAQTSSLYHVSKILGGIKFVNDL